MTAKRTPGPGANVALCRKARGLSQVALARRAGMSVSLLSKVEIGDRALTHGMGAALARAMGMTLDELLGKAPVTPTNEEGLTALSFAIRRFDLPGEPPAHPEELPRALAELNEHRHRTELAAVFRKLPGVLADVTNHAHAFPSPDAWTRVADTYSVVYWLAARHRWMHLAELAVLKQRLAAERGHPVAATVAARDEAGTFLNSGDFAGGLAVIDRAVVQAETTLRGRDRAYGLGILHLRGLTLAGRARERGAAERHIDAAWRAAEEFAGNAGDVEEHGLHFGPENTAVHVIATSTDLERHRAALETARDLLRSGTSLPATRVGPLHMTLSRSHLALGDRDAALSSLEDAWEAAPELARVHPTCQELVRVLTSLHRRANPRLTHLARRAGVPL
ncbi:helix-turn-helix domain-containing protein [Streptomyces sp. 3MP-14]|uniref:Helix-turn-helix domain-containing protein n=1 Tax=Streptomyces mimosae TaxID=2586635 RepID=A0A5N6ANV8_9ACTN|nr:MULTISPECIES: helix-turn-helix domain-containing protein [Streptomyces]KAB8169802.1 helix-turn-helix domain-containing protein [Streptomyces mimosae]KAB8178550.1 helix-turn-helix domain-containing protein [Streptomyces sp. 3MP-14]